MNSGSGKTWKENPHGMLVLAICSLALAIGIGIIAFAGRTPQVRMFTGTVKDLLPSAQEVPMWDVRREAIARTPELKAKVSELLNYSEGEFLVYTKGNQRLSVYIAYWTPGRMSYRLVAGHTPDVCWVGAGWFKKETDANVTLLDGNGGKLLPGEGRVMVLNNSTEHVMFWHLVDGVPLSYGTGKEPPWYAIIGDLLSRNINQRGEQFFIRVSSNEPVADWPTMEAYVALMKKLSVLHASAAH